MLQSCAQLFKSFSALEIHFTATSREWAWLKIEQSPKGPDQTLILRVSLSYHGSRTVGFHRSSVKRFPWESRRPYALHYRMEEPCGLVYYEWILFLKFSYLNWKTEQGLRRKHVTYIYTPNRNSTPSNNCSSLKTLQQWWSLRVHSFPTRSTRSHQEHPARCLATPGDPAYGCHDAPCSSWKPSTSSYDCVFSTAISVSSRAWRWS